MIRRARSNHDAASVRRTRRRTGRPSASATAAGAHDAAEALTGWIALSSAIVLDGEIMLPSGACAGPGEQKLTCGTRDGHPAVYGEAMTHDVAPQRFRGRWERVDRAGGVRAAAPSDAQPATRRPAETRRPTPPRPTTATDRRTATSPTSPYPAGSEECETSRCQWRPFGFVDGSSRVVGMSTTCGGQSTTRPVRRSRPAGRDGATSSTSRSTLLRRRLRRLRTRNASGPAWSDRVVHAARFGSSTASCSGMLD